MIAVGLALLLVTFTLGGLVTALYNFCFRQGETTEFAVRQARRLRLLPPEPETLENRPLAPIARDLRRLHLAVRDTGHGTSMARRTGILAAYDDVLLEACRAVDLPDTLTGLPEGTERDAERLRLEYLLDRAGLTPYSDAA
ncbi:MAG: hypothetical protein ABWX84_07855 [Nocardioides sp.]